jgi:hypothetical protein
MDDGGLRIRGEAELSSARLFLINVKSNRGVNPYFFGNSMTFHLKLMGKLLIFILRER